MKSSILTYEEYQEQQIQEDIRFEQFRSCKSEQDLKEFHKEIYKQYHKEVSLNWKRKYEEQKGWGIVKPVIDLKRITPLCKYTFRRNSIKGCDYCKSKRYWQEIFDKTQEVWALYFSMNLMPLWTKLKKRWPNWTQAQVQNNRYWRATKHKLMKQLEIEFLKSHPGPWCRALNRAKSYQHPKTGEWIYQPHTTFTFGIWYNKTMEQIGVYLRWPPEPFPITIQFLGRPKPGIDFSKSNDNFILSEETINNSNKRKNNTIQKPIFEPSELIDTTTDFDLSNFEHLL